MYAKYRGEMGGPVLYVLCLESAYSGNGKLAMQEQNHTAAVTSCLLQVHQLGRTAPGGPLIQVGTLCC